MTMTVDAIITAGDGRAARKVFKKNKALLEVGGKSILRHIVDVLLSCKDIGKIVVVGPKTPFSEVLDGLDVDIIEQKRSLCENGWEGFLQTLPEYKATGKLTDDIIAKYRKKYVLFLSGDIPLLTVKELEEFLSHCDMDNFDYIAGITSEEILNLFGPRKGRPGIKMATFHTRDGNFRQNNLHIARPFLLIDSIDLVLKTYEYRYQKEFINIARTIIEILKLGRGFVGKSLFCYLLFQISAGFSAIGIESLAYVTSYPITLTRMEELISKILHTRFKTAHTTLGGAALDVDNERDFLTLSVMYKDWVNLLNQNDYNPS
ncbi:MAG: nucleotidyltransferase family protein [Thermodesulfobacteriota bacterium]|nr:nucleotidyltransferase family protein [Thermodesulfobacteriota bacterium]